MMSIKRAVIIVMELVILEPYIQYIPARLVPYVIQELAAQNLFCLPTVLYVTPEPGLKGFAL